MKPVSQLMQHFTAIAASLIILFPGRLCCQQTELLDSATFYRTRDKQKMFVFAVRARNLALKQNSKAELGRSYYFIADFYLSKLLIDSAMHYNKLSLELMRGPGQTKDKLNDLSQRSTIFMKSGKYEEAYRSYLEALRLLQNKNSDDLKVSDRRSFTQNLMNSLGTVLIKQGRYREADSLFRNLLAVKEGLPAFTRLYALGNIASVYAQQGKYPLALTTQQEALKESRRLNDLECTGISLQQIGNTYFHMGEYDSALNYYQSSIIHQRKLGDKTTLAQTLNNIASVYTKLGKPSLANSYFLESATLKQEAGDEVSLAITYGNIGLNYLNYKNYVKARKYFELALSINMKHGIENGIALSYQRLGGLLNETGKYDTAKVLLLKSIALFEKLNDAYRLMISKVSLAETEISLGNHHQALQLSGEALKMAEVSKASFWHAQAALVSADASFCLKQINTAEQYLKKALEYGEGNQNYEILAEAYRLFSDLYKARGKFDLALEYHKKMTRINDSVFDAEKYQQIAELETIYETEKKEKENIELRAKTEIQEIKLANRSRTIWFMTGAILIIMFLMILLYHYYRKRTLANKILVAKNLELAHIDKLRLEMGAFMPENMRDMSLISYETEQVGPGKDIALIESFNKYLAEEKPYLYSNISIEDICVALNTNRTYLSHAINTVYKKSFNSIINELRIRAARQMLTDPKFDHISLEGVGEMSGYNSRVVFYKNFKRITGLTPSYFKSSLAKTT